MAINNANVPEDTLGDPQVAQLLVGKNGKAVQVIDHELGEVWSIDADGVATGTEVAMSVDAGITASTTQTQGQRPLTAQVNQVSTVANANDTVTMPSAKPGLRVYVRNDGANVLKVFPASGDAFEHAATNAAITINPDTTKRFVPYDTTHWLVDDASEIGTTGAGVDVSGAPPPTAGQVLAATDATHAVWGDPYGSKSRPLFTKPASPHADDEEFEGSGVPSGWVLCDSPSETSPVTIVPSGTPDPYTLPASGAAKFAQNAGWRSSWGALQLDGNDRARNFAKPITPATNMFVWTRMLLPSVGASPLADACYLGLFADNGGKPDGDNCVLVGYTANSGNALIQAWKLTAGVASVSGQWTATKTPPGYFALQKVGTDYFAHGFTEEGLEIHWPALTHAMTVAWMGYRVVHPEPTGVGSIARFDFIRRVDSAQGLPI